MRFEPLQKINIIATTGALGDTVATFPTLKLLFDQGQVERLFVADQYLPLYRLLFPNELMVSLSDATEFIPPEKITPDVPKDTIDPVTGGATFFNFPVNPNIPLVKTLRAYPSSVHMPLVDCFSIAICDCILKEGQRNYPYVSPEKLPANPMAGRRYVVIAYGATTENRRMMPEVLNGLTHYFGAQGIEVVLLGKRDHLLRCSGAVTSPTFDAIPLGCVDLIDQTTLPEALAIIHGSKMVIGLDNGLIHLAALTDVPIVAGYTTVDPFFRVPQRHGYHEWRFGVVEPNSNCCYCQTENFCVYRINFLKCHTTTKECMTSLTLNRWLDQIDKFNIGA